MKNEPSASVMRVLVCGSRHFYDINKMSSVLTEFNETNEISTIIHGDARGADTLAGGFAQRHGIPVSVFPAQWAEFGKRAGPIRNTQMLVEGKPDHVIAFRAPNSRGTQNMINQATKAGIPVTVIEIE